MIDRYLTSVFRFSYSLLNDKQKAEDIAQETFLVLWEKAEKWEPTGHLRSWLFRIARNKSIDEIRRTKEFLDIETVGMVDLKKSPYNELFDHQLTDIMHMHMQSLPVRQREAITLVHFLECSNIEAAETMDISVDALESLLARGRRQLKKLLDKHKDLLFKEVSRG